MADWAENNIATWVQDWGLQQYQDILVRNYDDVDQICSLHKDDLNVFFDDNGVVDEAMAKGWETWARRLIS
ncbi:unnamed protein product [Effrenium voratum]|nr:unnamed protein product [Effrenium voratum]